jgi:hypothetical protein
MQMTARMILSKERIPKEQLYVFAQRRQQIAKSIHDLWTQGGSDLSGLVPALVDDRLDALGGGGGGGGGKKQPAISSRLRKVVQHPARLLPTRASRRKRNLNKGLQLHKAATKSTTFESDTSDHVDMEGSHSDGTHSSSSPVGTPQRWTQTVFAINIKCPSPSARFYPARDKDPSTIISC